MPITNRYLITIFIIFLFLCVIILANSQNKDITSIYSREGFTSDKNERMAGVLHSGDIIDIMDSDNNYFNRHDYNSQIIMITPEDKKITCNLSKLRIVSINHNDKSSQMPIKYGDRVVIAHNAYIQNKNSVRYIKYNTKLQSHQDGLMFRTFVIGNPTNINDESSYVKYDSPIILGKYERSPNICMAIEKDNTVSTNNTLDKASKFYLKLKRVYEPYEKNLCICTGETLYP
jgi:hypothetical protein